MKRVLLALVGLVVIVVLIPAGLVALHHDEKAKTVATPLKTSNTIVHVYMTKQNKVVAMPLEEYVRGVVAGEMPITFQLPALEAQAIAARTNVVRRLYSHQVTDGGADVTDDYRKDQAFQSDEALHKKWGAAYQANIEKLNQAVNATAGKILTYGGKPIDAMFFSTSSGATESSADVFGNNLPYLQSVPSPWDALAAPHYKGEKTMSLREFTDKLGLVAVPAVASGSSLITVLKESPTHHVETVRVGDKQFKGNDFRLALGLNSTNFTWNVAGDSITFHTTGYGHDVGLSQYGANGMASEGKTSQQILTYYYRGVTIEPVDKLL